MYQVYGACVAICLADCYASSSTWNLQMNRPPPYFPQNQLSPPDENRYKKFKYVVAGLIIALIVILSGIGVGIYFLVRWLF